MINPFGQGISRLQPCKALPAYSYVPGKHPHPFRDVDGHSHGLEIVVHEFDPSNWQRCDAYLFGVDLFNLGYYWESHERWEAVWNADGRRGIVSDFLKGLIKLAAAGVKAREGRENGVRRHAARSGKLFAQVKHSHDIVLGLDVDALLQFSEQLQLNAGAILDITDNDVVRLWEFLLRPVDA